MVVIIFLKLLTLGFVLQFIFKLKFFLQNLIKSSEFFSLTVVYSV